MSENLNYSMYKLAEVNTPTGLTLVPENQEKQSDVGRVITLFRYSAHINIRDKSLEQPERFIEAVEAARAFVEDETGLSAVAKVYLLESTSTEATAFLEPNNGDIVFGRDDAGADYDSDYYWKVVASDLVHEFTHSTGYATARGISIRDRESERFEVQYGGLKVLHASSLMGRTDNPFEQGIFYEEALAGEIQARWREKTLPDYKENPQVTLSFLEADIPIRYVDLEKGLSGGHQESMMGLPSFATHAMGLLNEQLKQRGEHDIFDLMIKARKPESQVKGKKELIAVVNSVRPDLYVDLRRLQYTAKDYVKGLAMVKEAIA